MSRIACWVLPLALLSPVLAAAPSEKDKAICEVWQRELSFAQTVARHDVAAFAEHVYEGAVFGVNTDTPTIGQDAIVQRWAPIIEGRGMRLSWYPRRVQLAGDPNVAYSSGPALVEQPSADAKPKYTILEFGTVWRRGQDRVWRVMFDGGDEGRPADARDVKAFLAGRRTRCPVAAGSS